jgi:glycosyltransferase 2 family protein
MKKLGGFAFEKAGFWRKAALTSVLLFAVFGGVAWGLYQAFAKQFAGQGHLLDGTTLSMGMAGDFGLKHILFLLATICVTTTLRMHRYVVFAKALGLQVPVRTMYVTFLAGMALLPTPGKVGVALRLYLLKRKYGYPYRRTGPMLLMDALTDSLAMLLVVGMAIAVTGGVAGMGAGLLLTGGVVAGIMALLFWPAVPRFGVKLLYRLTGRRKPRLFAGMLRLMSVVRRLFGTKVLAGTVLLSFGSWLILIGALSAVWNEAPLSLSVWALAICGGVVAGMASLMPGGMGGAEAGMVGLMVASGVPPVQALTLALVSRILMFWIPIVVGWIALPFAFRD